MTVESEEKLIRRWVERLRPFGRGRTYTPALRRRILAYVDLAKAAGTVELDCCKSIGVSPTSIRAWRRSEARELRGIPPETTEAPVDVPMELSVEPVSKDLVPVEVTPSAMQLGGGLSLVTPRGFRVEGLSLEQAFALLREFV